MSKKVLLAMSGGVDSSCALVLLKRQGYQVIGATMRLYDNEDKNCCSLNDVKDARAVAERYDVPHYVFDFRDRFKRDVIENFNNQYLKGLTPNPCVDCNKNLKFDALFEKAKELECDYIATGHYARIAFEEKYGRYLLKKAVSSDGINEKDQSYVLYNLTQEQLEHTIFPLGELTKNEVRKIAEENGLINHNKPDSQDICFVPDGDYAKFIREYTGIVPEKGDVIDKNGKVFGKHNGLINYTIGQRKGLGIAFGKPMYVVDKDVEKNTVIVGQSEDLLRNSLIASDLNWIAFDKVNEPVVCKAKTRYKQKEQPCTVYPEGENTVKVIFDNPQRAITRGQRVVFYNDDIVLGGGVIR